MALTPKQKLLRFLSPILLPVFKIYWKTFKPKTYGVKTIIENDGQFLLIRNAYGYGRWTFPGGKIDRGESKEGAATREAKEETGIDVKNLKFIAEIISTAEGKKDHINIFYGTSDTKKIETDEFEIKEACWLKEEDFPELSPIANQIWKNFITFSKK